LPGAKLFSPTCSNGYCHGAGGVGGGAPSLKEKTYTAEFLTKVITEGVAGTPMRGFNDDYSKDQIQQLVAFVQSLRGGGMAASSHDAAPSLAASSQAASAAPAHNASIDAGQEVFDKHCATCHTMRGGPKVGPDLYVVAAGKATPRALLAAIVAPEEASMSAMAVIAVVSKDGKNFRGVMRRDDDESIQIYDVSSQPPVSRTIAKEDIARIDNTGRSAMPGDFAARLTLKQLVDLVAYLRQAPVKVRDLF